MKRLQIIGAAALSFLLAGCGTNSIRLGTAPEGGVYYALGTLLAEEAKTSNLQIHVRETAGSMANLRLLSKSYIQAGIAQSDQIALSYLSETDPLQGYSAVASLYSEPVQVVVRADSTIETMDDLDGCIISIGQYDSGTEANAKDVLSGSGLLSGSVTLMHMNYTEACTALEAGTIDAMFLTSGAPAESVRKLSETTPVRLLSLDERAMTRLRNSHPYYTETVIPKGTYHGMTEDAKTLGIRAVFLAADSLSKDSVYELTKLLFEHAESFSASLGIEILLNKETAMQAVMIPLHPGAAQYYLEQGFDTGMESGR